MAYMLKLCANQPFSPETRQVNGITPEYQLFRNFCIIITNTIDRFINGELHRKLPPIHLLHHFPTLLIPFQGKRLDHSHFQPVSIVIKGHAFIIANSH